jgi:hypothetical protein
MYHMAELQVPKRLAQVLLSEVHEDKYLAKFDRGEPLLKGDRYTVVDLFSSSEGLTGHDSINSS